MTLEQSLAAREIAHMVAKGFGPAAATTAATRLLQSQGFGAAHSKQVAEQMARLVV